MLNLSIVIHLPRGTAATYVTDVCRIVLGRETIRVLNEEILL